MQLAGMGVRFKAPPSHLCKSVLTPSRGDHMWLTFVAFSQERVQNPTFTFGDDPPPAREPPAQLPAVQMDRDYLGSTCGSGLLHPAPIRDWPSPRLTCLWIGVFSNLNRHPSLNGVGVASNGCNGEVYVYDHILIDTTTTTGNPCPRTLLAFLSTDAMGPLLPVRWGVYVSGRRLLRPQPLTVGRPGSDLKNPDPSPLGPGRQHAVHRPVIRPPKWEGRGLTPVSWCRRTIGSFVL